ncbi:MAG: HD-GYP domain-containing protein, partial [Chloroflexota bacterium]
TLTMAVLGFAAYQLSLIPAASLLRLVPEMILFAGLGWLGSRYVVTLRKSSGQALGTSAQIATLLILPFGPALLSIAAAKLVALLFTRAASRRGTPRAIMLNLGGVALANGAAGGAYALMHGPDFMFAGHRPLVLLSVPVLVVMVTVFVFVNVSVVAGVNTAMHSERFDRILWQTAQGNLGGEVALVVVGIILAVIWRVNPVASLLVIVPMVISIRSFEQLVRLGDETVESVKKMARLLDLRDTGTSDHSQRLAETCGRLAKKMGMTPEHVADIVLGAQVHDIGKVGVHNDLLLKPGPLTDDERDVMQQHPASGADVLESFSAFRDIVPMVRHHHERWDGTGYPDGLAGAAIPIGARILTVVDAFDAMVSDRPYRKGLPVEEAVSRLRDATGTQFDPEVSETFIDMIIEDGIYTPVENAQRPSELRIVGGVKATGTAGG